MNHPINISKNNSMSSPTVNKFRFGLALATTAMIEVGRYQVALDDKAATEAGFVATLMKPARTSDLCDELVRAIYLTNERSLVRKVREAVLAVKLEQEMSKDEILERYLNTVYFGRGAYGIQAASQAYFGIDVEELTVADSAYLAGLIRSPETGDAERDPELQIIATTHSPYVVDAIAAVPVDGSMTAHRLRPVSGLELGLRRFVSEGPAGLLEGGLPDGTQRRGHQRPP